jgi:DNA-binding transcriptional ArsR family regulator
MSNIVEHMRRIHAIDDLETLKAIADPTRAALLELLAERHSVTELADALDVPRTRLYHHIELLESRGLIEQVDQRRVGPMTERIYALTAQTFRLSARLARSTDVETLTTWLFDTTRADVARAAALGRLSPVEGGRTIAFLDEASARAFAAELEALVERFDAAHDERNPQPYAFVWALYPSSRTIR